MGIIFSMSQVFCAKLWSEDEVKEALRSFESKRYHRDEIHPNILVKVSDAISPILSNIFNKYISSGVYPDILKVVRVVPI